MKYASLCDGIGAVHEAWKPLGWSCAWTSEIEPWAIAVVEQHNPGMANLGDMTKIKKEMMDGRGKLNLVCGGTPCQSFSVAGLRKGLADPRGNLALEFLRIVDGTRPAWVVWENVPGVLSVDGGRAFGSFLGGLGQLGYGFAYRVLDAQYFGVPQRRRRVFVVGYLGDWRRAAAVLFERQSLSGDIAPRREAGQGVAAPIDARATTGGFPGTVGGGNCSGPLAAAAVNAGGTGRMDFESETLVVGFNGDQSEHTRSMGERIEQSPTLRSDAPAHVCFPVQYPDQALRDKRQNGIGIGDDGAPSYTLERTFRQGVGVRRLTPRECERLQGFPDDYTAITFKGKPASDAARYRALGNSMAVPVMRWIGERIQMAAQWSNLGAET